MTETNLDKRCDRRPEFSTGTNLGNSENCAFEDVEPKTSHKLDVR